MEKGGDGGEQYHERLAEIERIQQAHQLGIDQLKSLIGYSEITPVTIETLVGLSLVALAGDTQLTRSDQSPLLANSNDSGSVIFNDRILRSLEWQAARRMKSGDFPSVLTVARAAAEWACFHHPGRFVSVTLENTLNAAGIALLDDDPTFCSSGHPHRILHIMTTALEVGGHTRLVDRWIRFDREREHSVVLTEQGEESPPSWLVNSVFGRISQLKGINDSEKVIELSGLTRKYDLIVFHIHPYDVVAIAACADYRKRPPTIFLNHADHLFWLGVGSSDIVLNLRPAAASLTVSRRAVENSRSEILPLPLDQPRRAASREMAKEAIGLPKESLLILTIASSWKYIPYAGVGFTDLIRRVLDAVPEAHLIAVGPNPESELWKELHDAFPNRVEVLGPTPHIQTLLEAADIYADSAPIGAMTSVLEATLFDTPAVTLSIPEVDYLGPTGFGSDALMRFSSGHKWQEAIIELLRNPGYRDVKGRKTAQIVGSLHFSDPWRSRLNDLYPRAAHQAQVRNDIDRCVLDPIDSTLAAIHSASKDGRSPETLLAAHGLLPRILT